MADFETSMQEDVVCERCLDLERSAPKSAKTGVRASCIILPLFNAEAAYLPNKVPTYLPFLDWDELNEMIRKKLAERRVSLQIRPSIMDHSSLHALYPRHLTVKSPSSI